MHKDNQNTDSKSDVFNEMIQVQKLIPEVLSVRCGILCLNGILDTKRFG